jgi:DNA segregation ATPase FtsK/SpoIIIE, S-DNA-T family
VTGVIKSNLPARLTYRVASKIDSRTVLGESGAEQLLGSGDLLFNPGNGTIRAHGPYVADEEVALVTAELRRLGAPAYVDAVIASAAEDEAPDEDAEADELYDRAVALVTEERKVSASLLQRRLQIGYNRAAGFVDRMEQGGLIGPMEGGKRAILVPARG